MTDRERLEGLVENALKACARVACKNCKHFLDGDLEECKSKLIADVLLEQGFTFKKKRGYIRKSPCKCGAKSNAVELKHIGKPEKWYYFCTICGRFSKEDWKKRQALIEWNKMNEVK